VYSLRGAPLTAPEPVAAGLALQRVWKDADGKVIDLSGGKVFLKKGDRVLVELTLSADSPLADVVVSDLLPGGLEFENPGRNIPTFANTLSFDIGELEFEIPRSKSSAADEETGEGEKWVNWIPYSEAYMDAREDQLLLFFDKLAEKTVYRYSLRAVSSGTFVLPPLAAEAMYAPENRAVTSGGEVIIE
jgi:uncharacterized protein YfaS (alpha-2-macroglobulin family)